MSFLHLATRPLLLALSTPALAQLPIVVDDVAGPGVDYTSLQAAVDAAGAGDSILVKPGTYAGFTIDGKTIRMGADVPSSVDVTSQVAVRNVAEDQFVALKGLSIVTTTPMSISSCDGAVQIEDCVIAATGIALFESIVALSVSGCDEVILVDCFVDGGDFISALQAGGTGLTASNSGLSIWDSQLFGGTYFTGVAGTSGAFLSDCDLFASGSTFTGGEGGPGDPDTGNPFQPCTDGAAGGAGLTATSPIPRTYTLIECTLTGGAGGPSTNPACNVGSAGPASDLTSVILDEPAIAARHYDLTFPIVQGVPGQVVFDGQPGDLVWTIYSLGADSREFPLFLGTLALADPLKYVYFGTIPGSGQKLIPVNVTLSSGAPFVAIHEQVLFFNLVDGFVHGTPRLAYVTSVGI